jgi:hypothetical protein
LIDSLDLFSFDELERGFGEKNMVIDEVVVLSKDIDIALFRFDLGLFKFNTL